MAVAFHPDAEYVALESGGEVYIVAAAAGGRVRRQSRARKRPQDLARFPGKKLEYAKFAHPFLDRTVLGVLADYVTMDQGTGVVHTAPSHGADDFNTGVKYKLDLTRNVDAAGIMRNGLPEYDGKKVFDANAAHRRAAEKARRADAFGKARALLSALLALPQSRSSFAPPSSGSSPWKRRCRAGPCAAGRWTKSRK